MRRALLLAVLAVAVLAACGGDDEPKVSSVPGLIGVLVDVGGHSMHLNCTGEGRAPTVLLEAGFGANSEIWNDVQLSLNPDTRVCRYDRAGLGGSPQPQGRRIRTTLTEVEDLERMLDAAEIDPPYVLVGHSYGGIIARLFAVRNRDDVVGIVLVDSAHFDLDYRVERLVRRRTRDDAEGRRLRAAFRIPPIDEGLDRRRSSAQVRAVRSLGAVPLVVLTAGGSDWLTSVLNIPVPPGLTAEIERLWLNAQGELARFSSDRIHGVVEDSNHFIHTSDGRPDVVVKAIEVVLLAARAETPLPSCQRVFAPSDLSCRA